MVLLSFILRCQAPVEPLWDYLADFENSVEWDPGVRKAKLAQTFPKKIGTTYDLITVFNGTEADVVYRIIEYDKLSKITLKGENKMITAIDEIFFKPKGPNET